ncbi:MAG: sulfatase-like hydrolase/transferase [Reichenbachiella sp.]
MNLSRHLKSVAILWSLSLISCAESKNNESTKPNVIIILADDLGYGDLSYFGQTNYQTPQMDKLANESVVCTDFYVPTPYCAPSRATLLTGRFPLRHGVIKNPTPDAGINDVGLPSEELTLGEVFQQADYKTMGIGKWHLGHVEEFFPVNHGFDDYYGILYSNDMRPVQIVQNLDTVEYPVDQNQLTQKYTQKALEFISSNKDNPFFLYLSHAMPHKPLAASEAFYTPDTPDDLYADVMRELDWSVGEVMNHLGKLDILDNTIVIFMSDNGPWFGGSSGGLKGMKATNWEGGIKVPFMIHYKKAFARSGKISVPCWSPDIYPTLLSLTQLSPPENKVDGEDITTMLQGKTDLHDPVFSMHNDIIMSVRKGEWKLFVNRPRQYKEVDLENWTDSRAPDGTTIIAPYEQATPAQYPGVKPLLSEGDIQLYNLKDDPTESNNMALKNEAILNELLEAYNAFSSDLKIKK